MMFLLLLPLRTLFKLFTEFFLLFIDGDGSETDEEDGRNNYKSCVLSCFFHGFRYLRCQIKGDAPMSWLTMLCGAE